MQPSEARVLVVDDMESARQNVIGQLKTLGFSQLYEAGDGASALQALEINQELGEAIHLVICDWMMPGMTGIELLARLRSNPAYGRIPFLMVTAEGETQKIVDAAKAGASGYIIKPFTVETLKAKVSAILSKIG
jgi:two-component system chemotaxis response regulator CheY